MTTKFLADLGLAVAIGVATAGTALATPIELTATTGAGPGMSVLLPNSGGDGMITYSNSNFNGWDITFAIGTSKSPSAAQGGLDLSAESADCVAAACDPLTIAVSDIGFTTPVAPNSLTTGLTNNVQNSAPSTITQWAYIDTANAYFGSSDLNAMSDFQGTYDAGTASLIGLLTLNGNGALAVNGGMSTSGPYSLTLVDQFCSNPAGSGGTCNGGLAFQSAGGISAPEPGGLALLGASLLGFVLVAGRRRSSRAQV